MKTSVMIETVRQGMTDGYTFNVNLKDGSKRKARLFISNTDYICEFKKGSRSRGWQLYLGNVESIEKIARKEDNGYGNFHRNVKRAAEMLEASGLWPKMKEMMKGMATLSEEDFLKMKECYERYDSYYHITGISYEERNELQKKAEEDFQNVMLEKNFPKADFYHWRQLQKTGQIVSIPYGDGHWDKETARETMKNKVGAWIEEAKEEGFIRTDSWRGKYDYSIEVSHKGGEKKAWYSAEYKNCGNGHYYLMLDASHALFYEDD